MNLPPPMIPLGAARLVAYIREHGHLACYVADDNLLAVTSAVRLSDGTQTDETEFLPVDRCAVQDWLGY